MPAKINQKITDTINPNARATIYGGRVESYWRGSHTKGRYTSSNGGNTIYDLPQILADYKLKGFEFGNWLNQDDRADAISAFIISIDNLSKIVGSKNLGFDNILGVAFGARGKSKALAHFEPSTLMINFTKEKGIGSMAHEWAHALDFVMGRYIDQHSTNSWLSGSEISTAATNPSNTGGQLRYHVNRIIDTAKATRSHARLANQAPYWRLRLETFARLFEQYVTYKLKAKNIRDHYLAKPITRYQVEPQYITDIEFRPLIPMFDALMKDVALFLNNKGSLRTTPYHTTQTQQKTAASKPKKPTAPKAPSGKINLYNYVRSKNTKRVLEGVYHDASAKKAVASDAQVMIITGKHYNAKYAGKVIDKNGSIIKEVYPKWNNLLPKKSEGTIDILALPHHVILAADHFSKQRIAWAKEDHLRVSKADNAKISYISFRDSKGKKRLSNYYHLQLFFDAVAHIGATKIHVGEKKLYAKNNQGDIAMLLIMAPKSLKIQYDKVEEYFYDEITATQQKTAADRRLK